jgi:conjugative transposon protein TcpC
VTTTEFYGLAVSRTNQARISNAGKWLHRTGIAVLSVLSVLGALGFYRTYINPPELNLEAITQRTVNEHDQIGGVASDFVELWLTSTDSTVAGLAPFIDMKVAGPPPKRDVAAATDVRSRTAAVIYRGSVGEVDSYSVTVTVMERQIPTAIARRKFYRMPVTVWHQQPRIVGWPLPVNGPGPGVQVKLDYPSTLEQSAPLYKVLAEFTETYLTKTAGMDRYALPGTVSPVGGYSRGQLLSVQLSEDPPQEAPSGYTIRALLQVLAKTSQQVPLPMTLPVTLENSNGTWMIRGIDLSPMVADDSPEPLQAGK